jgi:predicted Ser/Thr protein kinase
VLAGRYRILDLVGRGGMGAVYRADDDVLGQVVALKFLPEHVARDDEWLARFRNEVRIARQVSHPNVCRVYDIGEANGLVFLSMEYIDGENLASLLRRIGRLSPDKAIELARGLCAGLAAAHDKGVLHRDLKPANVMIDGEGRVRLADFGLAGGAGEDGAGLAGTPAYMAPEQFAGAPASVQSDLYALGLVLYEMFTGKPVFSGATVQDLARQHRETTPTSVTMLVGQIDPRVDRILQRCLAKDPSERPRSALTVAAALPGGDPLAAALAAGETPSPAMVAAAGGVGALSALTAIALMATVFAGLGVVVWLSAQTQIVSYLPLERSPTVLADAAHQIIARLGYTQPHADSTWGFTPTDYVSHLQSNDSSPRRWENLRPGQPPGVTFWYRESPVSLTTPNILLGGRVTLFDPWPRAPGMVQVMLDLKGRLHYLMVVPPRVYGAPAGATAPDWGALLREAGFDAARFTSVAPRWVPPVFADARAAWTGVYPDRPDIAIRVEAAGVEGRPVYFQVFEPWSPQTVGSPGKPNRITAGAVFSIGLPFLLLTGAVLLARRNLRLGRGDLSGASRLGIVLAVLHVLAGLLVAHHTPDPNVTFLTLGTLVARGLLLGMVVSTVYIALEPDVRRRWPETLIAWSRVLTGRLRDPLVGRDLLFGVVLGVAACLLSQLSQRSPAWIGHAPFVSSPSILFDGSSLSVLAAVCNQIGIAVVIATSLLLVFLFLFVLLRNRLPATSAFLIFVLLADASNVGFGIRMVFSILGAALATLAVTRLGLFTLVVMIVLAYALDATPLVVSPASWLAPGAWLVLTLIVALAVYAFQTSRAGQPLFDSRLLD